MRTLVTAPAAGTERRPALLFIQGVTLSSVDFPLTADNGYARIVAAFARGGFVTMRVDKPGVGDSEGGPGIAVDFEQELDAYRQALKALFARPDVDPARVFVFGHSMGGLWGPLLAGEFKQLRGLAVAGTGFRTWIEYTLENARRQMLLGSDKPAEVHAELQKLAPVMTAFLHERLSPAQITERLPALKATVDDTFQGDSYAGRAFAFWHQVNGLNLAQAWNDVDARVLVLWGANDFLVNGLDHELLAAHLNARKPGLATLVKLADSDHAFLKTRSQADSFEHWGKPGKAFNPNVVVALDQWIRPLAGRGLSLQ
jgi:pimeloyl-ACP methyl ester carboxylesterase